MTRIDAASQLAAIIRARLAAAGAQTQSAKRDRQTSTGLERNKKARGPGTPAESAAGGVLNRLIGQRVTALKDDDPDRHRKAFRIFLESALVQEFGIGMIDDAGFQRLIDQVHEQMDADPGLRAAMREAAELLLNQAESGQPPPA